MDKKYMRTSVTDLVVFHMFSIMTEILKTELACVGSLRIICICYELEKQFIFFYAATCVPWLLHVLIVPWISNYMHKSVGSNYSSML